MISSLAWSYHGYAGRVYSMQRITEQQEISLIFFRDGRSKSSIFSYCLSYPLSVMHDGQVILPYPLSVMHDGHVIISYPLSVMHDGQVIISYPLSVMHDGQVIIRQSICGSIRIGLKIS